MQTKALLSLLLLFTLLNVSLAQRRPPLRSNDRQKNLSDIAQTFRDGFNHNFKGQDVNMRSANFKYGDNCQYNSNDLKMSSSSLIAKNSMDININGNLELINNSKIDLGPRAKINVKTAIIRDSEVKWDQTAKGNIKGKWTFINSTFNGKKIARETKNFN